MTEQADLILVDIEERMAKAIDAANNEFKAIRTGRANPAILDKINVSYYGVETPLKQVGSVSVVDGNQLYIKPYDLSILKDIEMALMNSQLGLTPQNDGTGVRLVIPALTQDRRKQLVKDVDKLAESAKVAIRNVRRDGNDQLKKVGLTEDLEKGYLEDVQKLTDTYSKKVDVLAKEKADELLKI